MIRLSWIAGAVFAITSSSAVQSQELVVLTTCMPIEHLTGKWSDGKLGRREIYVDGKEVDGVAPCNVRTVRVAPGTRELQISKPFLGIGSRSGPVTVKAGSKTYVMVDIKTNHWYLISAEDGLKAIANMQKR